MCKIQHLVRLNWRESGACIMIQLGNQIFTVIHEYKVAYVNDFSYRNCIKMF